MENMEGTGCLKDAYPAPKCKSIQNLVAAEKGVHTYTAGESMSPFTEGDLQDSGEISEQLKKDMK